MFLGPFGPNLNAVSIAATTSSQNVQLPAGTLNQLELYNAGGVAVFVNFGGSGVTAAVTNYFVPPGADKIITIPAGSTYMAAITASGTATIYAAAGEGT